MFGDPPAKLPQRISFYLPHHFTMIALMGAVDPLRLANWIAGQDLYEWQFLSVDGKPVWSSNGVRLIPDAGIAVEDAPGTLVVTDAMDLHAFTNKDVLGWLRRVDRRGADIGALGTGAFILAKAGLLDGYRCTAHWDVMESLREAYPDLDLASRVFEVDRRRFTCAGGSASIDMMLNLIIAQHGGDLAEQISEQLIHDRIRDTQDDQRMALHVRPTTRHPKLLGAIAAMEANLENPMTREELAEHVNLSIRQLERLFRRALNRSPTRFYLELRLRRARRLLLQTSMPITDIAMACGFMSAGHFTTCYRRMFGLPPRDDRRPSDKGKTSLLAAQQAAAAGAYADLETGLGPDLEEGGWPPEPGFADPPEEEDEGSGLGRSVG